MRRFALFVVAVAACKDPKPAVKAPPPVAAADAAPATVAEQTWRGPNLYTFADGALSVGVALRPPGDWREDYTADRLVLTSAAGSTMRADLLCQGPCGDRAAARAGIDALARARFAAATAPAWDQPVTEIAPGVLRYELHGGGRRTIAHDRVVGAGTAGWILDCEVELVDADVGLAAELAKQCAELDVTVAPDDRFAWTLEVTPATVALADLETVTTRIAVTNRAAETLAPPRDQLELLVDGKPSMSFGMGFGNGGRVRTWSALPAGQTVDDSRVGLALVDAAGDHALVLSVLGREVARATLHVTK